MPPSSGSNATASSSTTGSKHIVLQSRNALEALNLSEVAGITAARANGCKLTVMDVRATVSAAGPTISSSSGPAPTTP